ncbi:MAG: hypothetical protein E7131_04655 [Rikenellaceae bacterium]|nr:hypothetical protein [Rikenellaceae bacterium]
MGIIPFILTTIRNIIVLIVLFFLFGYRFNLWRWCSVLIGALGVAEVVLFLMPGIGGYVDSYLLLSGFAVVQIAATLKLTDFYDAIAPSLCRTLSFAGLIVGAVVVFIEMLKEDSFLSSILSAVNGVVVGGIIVGIVYLLLFRSTDSEPASFRTPNDEDRDWDSGPSSGGSGRSAGDRHRRQDRGQSIRSGSRCCANCQHRTSRGYCNLSDVPVGRTDVCAQFRHKWMD